MAHAIPCVTQPRALWKALKPNFSSEADFVSTAPYLYLHQGLSEG